MFKKIKKTDASLQHIRFFIIKKQKLNQLFLLSDLGLKPLLSTECKLERLLPSSTKSKNENPEFLIYQKSGFSFLIFMIKKKIIEINSFSI